MMCVLSRLIVVVGLSNMGRCASFGFSFVSACVRARMRKRACVCVRMRACVRACVSACVRACVRVCVCVLYCVMLCLASLVL